MHKYCVKKKSNFNVKIPVLKRLTAPRRRRLTLRHLALNYNYADLNVALRDQLVCGILDESTRVELFKKTELTFDKALKDATARERAIKNAAGALQSLFVTGKTHEEHVQNVRSVCKKLTERGLCLNKCEFMKKRIEALEFVIDKDSLHKTKAKVKAMFEAPRSADTRQLSAFFGLIKLENRADKLRPLYDCANTELARMDQGMRGGVMVGKK